MNLPLFGELEKLTPRFLHFLLHKKLKSGV
jgi:hypothetical protein